MKTDDEVTNFYVTDQHPCVLGGQDTRLPICHAVEAIVGAEQIMSWCFKEIDVMYKGTLKVGTVCHPVSISFGKNFAQQVLLDRARAVASKKLNKDPHLLTVAFVPYKCFTTVTSIEELKFVEVTSEESVEGWFTCEGCTALHQRILALEEEAESTRSIFQKNRCKSILRLAALNIERELRDVAENFAPPNRAQNFLDQEGDIDYRPTVIYGGSYRYQDCPREWRRFAGEMVVEVCRIYSNGPEIFRDMMSTLRKVKSFNTFDTPLTDATDGSVVNSAYCIKVLHRVGLDEASITRMTRFLIWLDSRRRNSPKPAFLIDL